MISLCLVISGYVYRITGNKTCAAGSALLTATLPLAESHTLVFGYAELWLTSVVVASCLLIALGIRERKIGWQIAGVLFAALALTVKNIGVAYAGCIWLALLFTALLRHPTSAITLISLMLMSGYFLLLEGFVFEAVGQRFYWTPKNNEFYFGGRAMEVFLNSPTQIFVNQLYSLVVNQSFSTAGLALFFSMSSVFITLALKLGTKIFALDSNKRNPVMIESDTVFLIFAATLALSMFVVSQFFLPFSYDHALPHSDTGNSRFSLPFVVLAIPVGFTLTTKFSGLQPR